MSDLLNLDLIDADGAVRDSAEAIGIDRSTFIKRGAIAGGGLIAGSAFFSPLSIAEAAISKKRSKANDVKILNFALTLEFLEAAFYKEAVANAAYGTDANLKKFAEVVAKHEATHVKFLKGALGSAAIKSPKFDFGKAVTDTGDVRRHRSGARGHRRHGLPRPGHQRLPARRPRRRGHHRHGRGAPRRVDPLHQRRVARPPRPSTRASPRPPSSRPSERRASSSRRRTEQCRMSTGPSGVPSSSRSAGFSRIGAGRR